jgi:hypothetical protein
MHVEQGCQSTVLYKTGQELSPIYWLAELFNGIVNILYRTHCESIRIKCIFINICCLFNIIFCDTDHFQWVQIIGRSCVHSSKESYRLCKKRLRNWRRGQGPTKGSRAIDEWVNKGAILTDKMKSKGCAIYLLLHVNRLNNTNAYCNQICLGLCFCVSLIRLVHSINT